MAYDKIITVRSRLDHCVDYVLNHEKTDMAAVLDYIGRADKKHPAGPAAPFWRRPSTVIWRAPIRICRRPSAAGGSPAAFWVIT